MAIGVSSYPMTVLSFVFLLPLLLRWLLFGVAVRGLRDFHDRGDDEMPISNFPF